MNGSVSSKARYMNGVSFEILARTPVPQLPQSYPDRSKQVPCIDNLNFKQKQIWAVEHLQNVERYIRKLDASLWSIKELICFLLDITKTRLYNFDPLKPHFYIVKLGFTGL